MIIEKSNLQKTEEIIKSINDKTPYRARYTFFSHECRSGYSIKVKVGFLDNLYLQYHENKLAFYTKDIIINEPHKKILEEIEHVLGIQIVIKDIRI